MHGSCDKREVEVRSIGRDNLTSDVEERDETDSEDREEDLWAIVVQDQSGGFNTSLRVIMLILEGVDDVVSEGPANTGSVKRRVDFPRERSSDSRPADKRTPSECQAQESGWPISEALEKWIRELKRKVGKSDQGASAVCPRQEVEEPSDLDCHEDPSVTDGHGPGWNWPVFGTSDETIHISVKDVIDRASGRMQRCASHKEEWQDVHQSGRWYSVNVCC